MWLRNTGAKTHSTGRPLRTLTDDDELDVLVEVEVDVLYERNASTKGQRWRR